MGEGREIKKEYESLQDFDDHRLDPVSPAPDCNPKTEIKEEWESPVESENDFEFVDFQLKSEDFDSDVQFPSEYADFGDESLSTQQIEQALASSTSQERFTWKCNVKTHVLPRIVLKPYSCQLCDGKFIVKSHLRKHALMHEDRKPT